MRTSPEKGTISPKPTPSPKHFAKEVLIIGGGMGGCMSAWRLAQEGWKVTILESAEEVLLKSANQTPGRMGLGFHYADLDTAEKYLRATMNFVKQFPGFEIGKDKAPSHFLKHGRYFITKDSLHSSKEICATYDRLKTIYTKLVELEVAENRIINSINSYGGDQANLLALANLNKADRVQFRAAVRDIGVHAGAVADADIDALNEVSRAHICDAAKEKYYSACKNGFEASAPAAKLNSLAGKRITDPNDAPFGNPLRFFTVLQTDAYDKVVNMGKVDLAVETCENLLDWPKFREYFLTELKKEKNITIITNATVKKAARTADGQFVLTYRLTTPGSNKRKSNLPPIVSPYVLNCAWQNSDRFDVQLGFKSQDKLDRTNRIKVLAEVDLPETLKELHSSFFLTGPHCMVSNMGNGKALMSYAPITNVNQFSDLKMPKAWSDLVDGRREDLDINTVMPDIQRYIDGQEVNLPQGLKTYLDQTQKEDRDTEKLLQLYYGERVKEGVAQYIPEMAGATVTGVRFGVVKTKGDVNINEKNSAFHKRDYSGIEEQQVGWITNDLMKLLYGLDNANEIVTLLKKHFELDKKIFELASSRAFGNHEVFLALRSAHRKLFHLLPASSSLVASFADTESTPSRSQSSQSSSSGSSEPTSPTNRRSLQLFPSSRPIPIPIDNNNNAHSDEQEWSQEFGTYKGKPYGHSTPTHNHARNLWAEHPDTKKTKASSLPSARQFLSHSK